MAPVRTTCPYCGVGCGVIAERQGEGWTIKGDPDHPANYGRLCSKGSALGETLELDSRILHPTIGGKRVGWAVATQAVADRFSETIAQHGPDSVAFYVSGQLLTEDYYIANKLMKGFIGSANIDTNSRLCMASSVVGHVRAFGADTVPGLYEDLEETDLLVLVGSNLAWCHPVLFQRIAAAKAKNPGMRVINIDPRTTATSDLADQSLRLKPGSDVALFQGLLYRIGAEGAIDDAWVRDHVRGAEAAMCSAASATIDNVARSTGLDPVELCAFYAAWIGTERVVTVYSQGVNQSSDGTDKVNAIINCHLASGRIGKPGAGPFSVTGQPNAMGGREVGGLANQLACHLAIENSVHRSAVQDFWGSPTICEKPGLKAVDLFNAVESGKIKALWIMATNPAVSMPEADRVRAAIESCPFTVVSDVTTGSETARLADVLLPAAAWGEKDGTVTNSERVISRQRGFLPLPGDVKADWRIMRDVAWAMGWREHFDYHAPADIFREYAELSEVAAKLERDLDLSGMIDMTPSAYDNLEPVRWPVPRDGAPGGRFFADGRFFTPDGRAKMIPISDKSASIDINKPVSIIDGNDWLRLNTGRIRDQWHTMTRTGLSTTLQRHMAEPFVEIHPEDAVARGIVAADLVRLHNEHGIALVRALVTARTPKGSVFAPMHWSDTFSSAGRIDSLIKGRVDPYSGQPASKAGQIKAEAAHPAWYGYALSRQPLDPGTAYWAKARVDGGWQYELADMRPTENWQELASSLIGTTDMISVVDPKAERAQFVAVVDGRIEAALFLANKPVSVARGFALAAFADNKPAELLPARPGGDRPDPGAVVCSCFNVGVNTITQAIAEHGLQNLDGIGQMLSAGTNCGSCRPELNALLAQAAIKVAAE